MLLYSPHLRPRCFLEGHIDSHFFINSLDSFLRWWWGTLRNILCMLKLPSSVIRLNAKSFMDIWQKSLGIHTSAMLGLLLWHNSLKSLIFNKVSYIVTFPWALPIRWKKLLTLKWRVGFSAAGNAIFMTRQWQSCQDGLQIPESLGEHSQKHNRTQHPSTRNLCGQVACHTAHLVAKLGAFPIAVPGPRVLPG